jgi:hypothetical protein
MTACPAVQSSPTNDAPPVRTGGATPVATTPDIEATVEDPVQATLTPVPTDTPTPTQSPTATPMPTAMPTSTPTPLPFSPGSTPHVFVGTATINGLAAPPRTMVSAWIEDTLSGIAEVGNNGEYGALIVGQIAGKPPYSGKTITFTIGNLTAGQTATWQSGAADVLDLTATQYDPQPTLQRS